MNKMKPMTKKTTSKNKVVEESASTIKNYFKTAPNVCVEKEKERNAFDSKAVYVQALKDRIKSYNGEIETDKENVTNECDTIQDEGAVAVKSGTDDGKIHERDGDAVALDGKKANSLCGASCVLLRQKYDDLKKSHIKLSLRHCELSMKYDELLKIATNTVTSSSDDVSDVLSPTDNTFTVNEIRILESLPLDKNKDSTFILRCIEYAYKENTSSLVNKTLKGTPVRIDIKDDVAVAVRPSKDPLTPEKVQRIQELFIKRVNKSGCLAGELAERIVQTNINRLIASAVRNVTNKEKPKDKLSKRNVNLNL